MAMSVLVSTVSFLLPLVWTKCTPLPNRAHMVQSQIDLVNDLVPFLCDPETEYNEVASLTFTDAGSAIRQLFHLHKHPSAPRPSPSFSFPTSPWRSSCTGSAFHLSNTYALIGAAAVLGGMARMTISLTVTILECTGNEMFVLPLMLTLMTARIVGGLFNDDLYHILIHLKHVNFLESELRSLSRHHK
jgi:chloride channel 7